MPASPAVVVLAIERLHRDVAAQNGRGQPVVVGEHDDVCRRRHPAQRVRISRRLGAVRRSAAGKRPEKRFSGQVRGNMGYRVFSGEAIAPVGNRQVTTIRLDAAESLGHNPHLGCLTRTAEARAVPSAWWRCPATNRWTVHGYVRRENLLRGHVRRVLMSEGDLQLLTGYCRCGRMIACSPLFQASRRARSSKAKGEKGFGNSTSSGLSGPASLTMSGRPVI